MELKGYDKNGTELQPLSCDVKLLKSIRVNSDTTKIFFESYYHDSSNVCYFKPLGLSGITIVRQKLYIPIYHTIVFDSKSDNEVLKEMGQQSQLLRKRILGNSDVISTWLKIEADKRKVP